MFYGPVKYPAWRSIQESCMNQVNLCRNTLALYMPSSTIKNLGTPWKKTNTWSMSKAKTGLELRIGMGSRLGLWLYRQKPGLNMGPLALFI